MKILIIRNYPSYMSVKNNTYNIQEVGLAKSLVRKGHNCDILFWTKNEPETIDVPVDSFRHIRVFYRKGKTLLKNTVFFNCEDLFEKYDILQPCEYNQMQSWILAKKYSQKTVIYHGPYYSTFNKRYNFMCFFFDLFFLRRYLKLKTRFIVKSELAREFLIGKGISKECICVAGVGIDAQMLQSNNEKSFEIPFIKKMYEDESKLKILYVGRFEKRRNIFFIIDVFREVLNKNNNAHLYLIGTGEKKYLEKIFSYIKEMNLSDRITYQDKIEQKYLSQIYSKSDFFLLPTEYEIFGMVLLEAMYFGNIVFTTRNGGALTLNKNAVNGFILDGLDVSKWANLILSIYENKQLKNSVAVNSTVSIKNYTWDNLVDLFCKQYSTIN